MRQSPETYKPAVVIPAYRRPEALRRLLRSVNEADYPDAGCTLIISLEGGAEEEVIRIAKDFEFQHGDKEIVRHSDRLGLKAHVYECAGYSQKYGSIIVLEEDLVVSPAYYHYAVRALQAYQSPESVAGISLYAQRFNETAQLPFEPMPSYFAGYFMKLACSWGQAWTAKQWEEYQRWINRNPVPEKIDDVRIPKNIQEWPAESWKREFNWYLLQTERTIFYPYQSLTTNSSHYGGENMSGTGGLFDVPLVGASMGIENLTFPELHETLISYDMYMEADGRYIKEVTGVENEQISVDVYGYKPVNLLKQRPYFITSKIVENPVKRFPLLVKPLEQNLKHAVTNAKDGFFSLAKSEEAKGIQTHTSSYFSIAQHCSYNRTDTKRFIIANLKQSIKKKL